MRPFILGLVETTADITLTEIAERLACKSPRQMQLADALSAAH